MSVIQYRWKTDCGPRAGGDTLDSQQNNDDTMKWTELLLLTACVVLDAPTGTDSVSKKSINPSERMMSQRLSGLRQLMKDRNLAAWIVTSSDAHQNEIVGEGDKRLQWITGFDGSNGAAVVTMKSAVLWTDSRYYEQAGRQLSDSWTLMKSGLPGVPSLNNWVLSALRYGDRVGADPSIISYGEWTARNSLFRDKTINQVALEENLIDLIWEDQPEYSRDPLFVHPERFTGMSRGEKLAVMRNEMVKAYVNLYVVTALDEIAWITNLRGSDITNTPVFRSYLVITDTSATLYLPCGKHSEEIITELNDENKLILIAVREYRNFWSELASAGEKASSILLPSAYNSARGVSYKVYMTLPSNKVHFAPSPALLVKALKNSVETMGMRNAHLKDAAALCQFLAILEKAIRVDGEEWDELSAVKKLSDLRAGQEHSRGESFATVAAYGPNSALPHYMPDFSTNVLIGNRSTFMLDSGGQYYDGTTDVTRTMHYGIPTNEQRATYTALLAGCIDLARLKFPIGVTQAESDLIMRAPLYKLGRNYGHGTTHGIGHFLDVHEAFNTTYGIGFFGSQEPGYYKENTWGMRLENIVTVVLANTTYDPEKTFLTFETVTLVPYERNLIIAYKLSEDQLEWLNDYHKRVRAEVSTALEKQGKLDILVKDWLVRRTEPIRRRQ